MHALRTLRSVHSTLLRRRSNNSQRGTGAPQVLKSTSVGKISLQIAALALLTLAQVVVTPSGAGASLPFVGGELGAREHTSTQASLLPGNTAPEVDPVIVGAGDIASCGSSGDEATAALLDTIPGTVFTIGDNAYEAGSPSEFTNCYEPTWGRHKARTRPAPGNHDYQTGGATGYYNYFGAAAGDPTRGYYSYVLDTWLIIVINSNCSNIGGCGTNSPQEVWLRNELAANTDKNVLAYWHHPRFASGSGHGNNPSMQPIWQTLYNYGADVVLGGHDHNYERFAPQNPTGGADPSYGIREFVVGTGGRSHYSFNPPQPNSEVRNTGTYGVIKLTLHPTSYDWQFVPQAGQSFTDSGTGLTHGAPSSNTATPAPATSTLTRTSTRTATSIPSPTPAGTNTPGTPSTTTPTGTPDVQPSFPIRAFFYYPWFPGSWTQQGHYPYTNYNPSLGFYDSSNPAVISQHIAAMRYGGGTAGIASWWGQGTPTDGRISQLLAGAQGTPFRWSLYHEQEGSRDPTVSELTSDLTYMRDRYGQDASYLRVNGRFVVFVYADALDGCGMADRWRQANTVGAYIVLKVFPGYLACANQPDSWHQYSPAVAVDSQGPFSYSVSPGFWQYGLSVRLARDLPRWSQNVRDMASSGAAWQIVTTFNEWGEGTSVESAQEWSSASGYGAYLDALHDNGVPATTPTPTTVGTGTAISTNTPTSNTPTTVGTHTAVASATATTCPIEFGDVPFTNPFYTAVRCLVCRGIISGYNDSTFRPNNQVTRGQLAKIVSNAAGFSETIAGQTFQDVPPTNTFYEWIERLTGRGHMQGYACGGPGEPCVNNRPYFRPFANATRGQSAKIVANAASFNEPVSGLIFQDVQPSHAFYEFVQRLATRNVMQGYTCGGPGEPCVEPENRPYFRPGANVTRGQSSKIVANTFFPDCQTP